MPAPAIRIRMYRVGFGDCFLVTLPTAPKESHILVDCGAHPRAQGDLAAVVADIKAATGGRIAVVIASHEHADHIGGFGQCADVFATFAIGELWMPWAMDPEDTFAMASRERRLRLALQLMAHFDARPRSDEAYQAVLNVATNRTSMAALTSRFRGAAGRIRYLRSPRRLTSIAGVPGLSARVVGPPRTEDYLKKMDPPAHERFFRMDDSLKQVVPERAVKPFRADFEGAGPRVAGWGRSGEKDLEALADRSLDYLAFALDHAVNNTSLSVIFTYRGRRLLFPGDAQYGNWKAWLDRSAAKAELGEISFLKVSHHGSENATPKSALTAMVGELAAMVSTQSKPWPSIPEPAIMAALVERTAGRVVRSDSLKRPKLVDGDVTAPMPPGFRRNELSIDYLLPI